jgi:homoserine dehydrogenase
MAKIAVLGYGTVGSGVVEVLQTNSDSIAKRAGEEIEVKYVLDLRDFPEDPIQKKIVHDVDIIINDKEIDVVVEVMGGIEPAFTFVKKALEAGKSVCTSNKALVAAHGPELLDMAKSRKLNFMFEASVGGGIPIIRPLNQSLTADEITQITGILNGTTNYILTKMSRDGSSYEDVLKEAQELGYAERNPEADVEGYDACRKIAILTSLAFGSTVKFEEIYTEGITKISTADFKYAEKLGCVVKLLATSFKKDGKVYAITAPFMIDRTHPLYNVNDVLNGVYVNGNIVGDVMFFGAGAGKLPTASAVVADVVDSVKHKGKNVMTIWSQEKLSLGNAEDVERSFFVRIKGGEDVLEKAKESFDAVQIVNADGVTGEFGLVTQEMTEKAFAEAAKNFEVVNRIRFDMTTLGV